MNQTDKYISVSQMKIKCLALLEEVSKTGRTLTITKRGKPIAQVVPLTKTKARDLRGSVRYQSEADLLAPVDEKWEADQ